MPATTLPDRVILRLHGEDVAGFLQGLVTSDVVGLAEGSAVWSGLLTAQGKALFDFLVWREGIDLLIDCEADQADALVRRLTLYRLRRAIAIGRDASLAVHWSPDGGQGASDPRLAALGHRWLAPSGEPATGWRAHRLTLGVTEGVAELGQDKTLWLEANARELNGVSFNKGCYVGQENTARMHHRSKVNRRLVIVRTAIDPGEAARAWYPDFGLAVVHRRIETLADAPDLVRPTWLDAALCDVAV